MTTFTTDDRLHAEKDGSFTIDCRLKPLTDDKIKSEAKYLCHSWYMQNAERLVLFARAIEKAHGIR
jgi:hypothetical protein